MINIDFHIHTNHTKWDRQDKSEFDINNLRKLIKTNYLDAIAITNHNSFDFEQYKMICDEMDKQNILVFPGIEISIDKCHALIIFAELCKETKSFLDSMNTHFKDKENINVDELILHLNKIDVDKFIFVPHVLKSNRNFDLNKIKIYQEKGIEIFAIECTNQKQQLFALQKQEYKRFTPVCFSDQKLWMPTRDDEEFKYRNTTLLLDKKDANWDSIINTLKKKQIRQFSNGKEFDFWKTREGVYSISLGLNIVLGKRGSGKTRTLDRIYKSIIDDEENKNYHPWYIRQFEIASEADEQTFYKELNEKGKKHKINLYDDTIDSVINLLKSIDIGADEQIIEDDLNKIKITPINEIWSRSSVFASAPFPAQDNHKMDTIVKSIHDILNSNLISRIVEKYNKVLKKLLVDVENEWKKKELVSKLKEKINIDWLAKIKKEIQDKTGKVIPNIYQHTLQWLKNYLITEENKNFFNYVKDKQTTRIKISDKYTEVTSFEKFKNKADLQDCICKSINKQIFNFYADNNIYSFIREMSKKFQDLPSDKINEIIKQALFDVQVKIVNEFGNCNLSGGERSYIKLIEKINDANKYDFLIVDEIEQSFDNIFLWDEIIQQKIKPLIEKKKTIIISTHNSGIALLSEPNRIIYCYHDTRVNEYKSYFGSLNNKEFKTPDGNDKINSFETIINILESGEKQYKTKKKNYENLKNANS